MMFRSSGSGILPNYIFLNKPIYIRVCKRKHVTHFNKTGLATIKKPISVQVGKHVVCLLLCILVVN